MKFLLTGRNGQVGWELERSLASVGEVIACDRQALDLAKPEQIVARVRDTRPDVIVNAAAYTAVDLAEKEPEAAMAINGTAPGILAEEAKRLGSLLVHYSTDYVFDGTKASPYTNRICNNGPTRGRLMACHSARTEKNGRGFFAMASRRSFVSDSGSHR